MHLLKGQAIGVTGGAEPVDLQQSPGDIVILSAADTEISGLAAARRALGEEFPSLRLANWMQLSHPYSVDLYGETVLARAKLVVLRLLGGGSYWRYGLDETVRLARANGTKLVVIPGDAAWDKGLAAEGTVPPEQARQLWSYLVEGGSTNLLNALRFCAHLIGQGEEPPEPHPLPSAGPFVGLRQTSRSSPLWGETESERSSEPGEGTAMDTDTSPPHPLGLRRVGLSPEGRGEERQTTPTAAVVFYRALMQAGQTEPVDALCAALRERGLEPLPIYVSSLKAKEDAAFVAAAFEEHKPAIVLNATAFALSEPGQAFPGTVLDGGRRPVLQVTFAGASEEGWRESSRGLSPTDLTMNVVLPEIDGRLITRAVSFKEAGELDPLTECRPVRYKPKPDRIAFVAELAARWAKLGERPAENKRVGIVLSNYPNRDGRLANGVGLDAPESTVRLLQVLQETGFQFNGAPKTSAELMNLLLAGPTNALTAGRSGGERLSLSGYRDHYLRLPEPVRGAMEARWGAADADPFVRDSAFILPVHRFGNVVVGIQPARGYNIDPKGTYHDPDLVPPHGYLAFYIWLREFFGADALVHMGKHGNLEWLPGKALALSQNCFPEAALGALPVIYPFIVNDPGEGAQAKRRSAAVVVDHLMPAMARAESYGPAAAMEALIDEYAAAQAADPRRAKLVAGQIFELAQAHGIDRDLGLDVRARDIETALAKLDEHICDLKELQIRDGLHVLGGGPEGRQRAETLVALARVPRRSGQGGDASLLRALAVDLGLGFDPLDCRYAELWKGPRPEALASSSPLWGEPESARSAEPGEGAALNTEMLTPHPLGLRRVGLSPEGRGDAAWRTAGDTVERLEALALAMVEGRDCPAEWSVTRAVLDSLWNDIAPALDTSGAREIAAVLNALSGRFVPPGPSGAPTRGRADCLPTGRNFYSVDVRAVPTRAAWDLGRRSADMLAERYFQDEGEWPRAIALTVWGTSNMRTGGDDIAQALALIGARPVWEGASGRVTGIEVMGLSELKRPRVDVTLRISGFFRDAFPHQIALFHEAVQVVAGRDEPEDANTIAARIRADAIRLVEAGLSSEDARKAASFRVFGSKPGAYGAGLQALIDEGIWAERKDLAAAFLEWSAYAYGGGAEGQGARDLLERRLSETDAIVQNQDNREHDLLDSDDYYQFEGGLAATVETLRGTAPRIFHNDHSRPERPVIRGLEEEIARVVRGRAANPKWMAGVMRHGYKGAFEIAATVDYLFAFAATTNAVGHHHFDQLYEAYVGDASVQDFIARNNPPALKEIATKFCEAVDRGLWAPRRNSTYDELRALAGLRDAA